MIQQTSGSTRRIYISPRRAVGRYLCLTNRWLTMHENRIYARYGRFRRGSRNGPTTRENCEGLSQDIDLHLRCKFTSDPIHSLSHKRSKQHTQQTTQQTTKKEEEIKKKKLDGSDRPRLRV